MSKQGKGLYEEFARFFEQPTREGLRDLIKKNIGELPNLDFKRDWPVSSKMARHLLGFANSGGGCIVVGITEKDNGSLEPTGLATLLDKAEFQRGVRKYIPSSMLSLVDVVDFAFEASEYPALVGKKFQVVFVEDDPKHLPFIAASSGDGIRESAIYVRRGTSTEEANNEELQRLINRRLETGYSSRGELDLDSHLGQLNVLYGYIDKYYYRGGIMESLAETAAQLGSSLLGDERITNPKYPKEDFEDFIARMIEKKKTRIATILDVLKLG